MTAETEKRYCVDCKHFQINTDFKKNDIAAIRFGRCEKYLESKDGNYHLISPRLDSPQQGKYCNVARLDSMCGPQAKDFEPKETNDD